MHASLKHGYARNEAPAPNPRGSQAKPEFPLAGGTLTDLAIPVTLTDLKYLAGSTWTGDRSKSEIKQVRECIRWGLWVQGMRLARVTCIFRDDLLQ